MFEAIFATFALAASPSPMPAATPLREIGRVRSRALCTTLRENVAPTLAKLIEGDARIVAGRSTFVKMGQDVVLKDHGHMELDRIALGTTVTVLARSIIAADTLLSDAKRFPANPQTDDERDAAAMKTQLQSVVNEQKHVLNLFSGLLETDLMGQMRYDLPAPIRRAVAPTGTKPPDDTSEVVSFLDVAGIPNGPANKTVADGVAAATMQHGLFGRTIYDTFAGEVARHQERVAKIELSASDTVNVALADCRSNPAPAASPTPSP
jgi:hypothetical protein